MPTATRRGGKEAPLRVTVQDPTAHMLLERLGDIERYPNEGLIPYQELEVGGKTYYFAPGGFLYRKNPDAGEEGGYLCGYLPDAVWRYRVRLARGFA